MIEVIDKPTQRRKLKVIDPIGLHARPASLLCNHSSAITDAEVEILFNDKQINAKSIMGILSLAIRQNDIFEIWIQGEDSDYVNEAIVTLVEKLVEDNIVEEINMGLTNIEEEVEATLSYLKRFPEDEFAKIIGETISRYCAIDFIDSLDMIEKICKNLKNYN